MQYGNTVNICSLEDDIRKIFNELCEEHDKFNSIEYDQFIDKCVNLFSELPERKLNRLTQIELKERLEKVAWLEVTSGMLSDLSKEEAQKFEEATSRRLLFSSDK